MSKPISVVQFSVGDKKGIIAIGKIIYLQPESTSSEEASTEARGVRLVQSNEGTRRSNLNLFWPDALPRDIKHCVEQSAGVKLERQGKSNRYMVTSKKQ